VKRTTWVPAGAADLVAATATGGVPTGRSRHQDRHAASGGDDAFDDRFPTQPIAVGRGRAGLVLGDRHTRAPDATSPRMPSAYREPPPSRHHHAASTGGVSYREPARTAARPPRSTILIVVAVVIAAVIGVLDYQSSAASSPSAAPDTPARSVPATSSETPETAARQAADVPRRHPPPQGALGEADGAVPGGVTVFDDEIPAVANLDPGLLKAFRQAATDAARNGVEFSVNSGWRSREYQNQLLREAVSNYGSEKEAARWVATADTSPHVSGNAIDIGHSDATTWLSRRGADYGLCQIYRNEPWHYELRPDAVDHGCPALYADPTHDPRMQQ
jgi:zinc D-Ala-D-Ala carboxypeptidase